MAKIQILVSGSEVLNGDDYRLLREIMADVATTANVGAKTVQAAIQKIGDASAIATELVTVFEPSATLEVYETPDGKTESRLTARYNVEKFAKRFEIAGSADSFSGEIFSGESTKTVKETVPQKLSLLG